MSLPNKRNISIGQLVNLRGLAGNGRHCTEVLEELASYKKTTYFLPAFYPSEPY